MDRPMTTAEFFNSICGILKEKGMMPDILDDAWATHVPVPMTTYPFRLESHLNYSGENSHIYLEFWIEYDTEDESKHAHIGTFETPQNGRDAMHAMGCLLSDFAMEEYAYRHAHWDDFIWTGADVYVFDADGQRQKWSFSYENMASARRKKDELLKKYPLVAIRNNRTRKEKYYRAKL